MSQKKKKKSSKKSFPQDMKYKIFDALFKTKDVQLQYQKSQNFIKASPTIIRTGFTVTIIYNPLKLFFFFVSKIKIINKKGDEHMKPTN